jgi:hypothetical protein
MVLSFTPRLHTSFLLDTGDILSSFFPSYPERNIYLLYYVGGMMASGDGVIFLLGAKAVSLNLISK